MPKTADLVSYWGGRYRLPSWPFRRVLELAPINWKKTLKHENTQQRLDANVFRRASLGLLDDHRPTSLIRYIGDMLGSPEILRLDAPLALLVQSAGLGRGATAHVG